MNCVKKEKSVYGLIFCMLLLAPGMAANAETNEFYLDEMVVTANRTEVSLLDANANISVVTREELENKHFQDLGEAIKGVTGVNVQNMGSSGEAYADNALYINGSKNIVFLIDGVRVNFNGSDSEKFSSADFINMDTVERIEILKGSASTLYGSDAQGGVINIVTRKGSEKIINKLTASKGSFSNENYIFSSSGSKNGYNWLISAKKKRAGNFKDGDGRRVPENINAENLSFKFGKNFDEKNNLTFLYSQYKSDYMKIKPKKNTDYSKTARQYGEKNNNNFLMTFEHKFNENTKNSLSFTRNRKNIKDNNYFYDQTNIGISDQFTHRAGKHHTIISGFEYTKDAIDKLQSVSNKDFNNKALYLQDIWDFSDQFNLTAGIREDWHSVYGSQNSKSVTFGYTPQKSTNYYISYKEFFIAPTVAQLYSANSGNPNLKAETGNTIELGMKHYFDKDFLVDFNIYKRRSKDAIGLVKKADGSGGSMYTNYDDEKVKGFSINLSKLFDSGLHANAGYTYIYIDPQSADKNPNKNGYLPRGVWNINLGYDKDRFAVDVDGRGVINRDGRKASKIKNSTTFWVWNLNTNYKINNNLKIFAQIANIFDTSYTERVYDLDPGVWYASPGRSYLMGVEYLF